MPAELVLGAAQLGMAYGVANRRGKMARQDALTFLEQVVQAGIGTIDTSPAYGDSEALVGEFIRTRGAGLRVVTKLPALPPGLSPAELRRHVADRLRASLATLHLPRVEDYLIHAEGDFRVYDRALYDALLACREKGLAGRVGLSVYHPAAALRGMELGMQVLQIPCNVLDRRFDQAQVFARARAQGVKVYARSIYLQGLLLLDPAQIGGWLPQGEEPVRRYQELARQGGRSPAEMAFVYVRDKVGIDSMVIGMETPDQIHSNLRLRDASPLGENELIALEDLFRQIPDEVVNPSLWRRP